MSGKGTLACIFGAKFEKSYNFFKFLFAISSNGYLDKFLKGPLPTLMHCALRTQIWRISCYTKLLIVVKSFSKDLVLVRTAQAIHSKKLSSVRTALAIRLKKKCHPFERLRLRTVPCIYTAALIHIKTKLVYEKA